MVNVNRFLYFFFLLFLAGCGRNLASSDDRIEYQNSDSLNLIPYPQQIEKREAYFELNSETIIESSDFFKNESKFLKHLLSNTLNDSIKVLNEISNEPNRIQFNQLFTKAVHPEQEEEYELLIDENHIEISAFQPQGMLHGIQTLRQLFITAFQTGEKREKWYLPALTIKDSPKFQHRGLLLDVCRHFFDKEVVKKYLDALSYYKMNVLHLHLTEDQGWRMPIDKYPLLNEISSWRLDSAGNQYGGFYSKDELKELVKYAEERYITIIPEIELPGHSQAALSAYPQFSCTGGPIEVANDWGVFKEIYCAGNDSTFTFIEDILTEVMEIFPSKYIHIGGDEAPKFRWEHCPKCQKRMKDEGLADEHELQSYFIKRIEKFLNDNGRELIGWDEILEGGLSDNAAVQSWRGFEGGMEAARTKHKVIMSPTSHCYLDYGLNSIDLQKIYSFDPIPAELAEEFHSYIIGGEGNMWTEHVPDEANLDSKVFPRIIALAEVLWTYNPNRNFADFYRRLQMHYPHLTATGINYGLETVGAKLSEEINDSGIFIKLEKNLADLDLKYRWNQDENFVDYTSPIKLEKSGELQVQAYKNGEPYGDPIRQNYVTHQALNKKVTYKTAYNQWYVGNGDLNLVDGKTGSIDFHDSAWQGFWGEDVEVIIDLVDPVHFLGLKVNFYQYANSWIFLPQQVEIETSLDGKVWDEHLIRSNGKPIMTNEKSIKTFEFHNDKYMGMYGRYIRLKATNIGKVPAGHEAEGQDAWLFIYEIIVE